MPLYEDKTEVVTKVTRTLLLSPKQIFDYIKQEYVRMVGNTYVLLDVEHHNYPREIRLRFVDPQTREEPDECFTHGDDDSYPVWNNFIDKMREDFGCYVNVPGYYWSK
jgi:hypothetical protein